MIVTIKTLTRTDYNDYEGMQTGHVAINSAHVIAISAQPVKTVQSDDPNDRNKQDVFVDIRMIDGQVITAYLGDMQDQQGGPIRGDYINALVDELNGISISS